MNHALVWEASGTALRIIKLSSLNKCYCLASMVKDILGKNQTYSEFREGKDVKQQSHTPW